MPMPVHFSADLGCMHAAGAKQEETNWRSVGCNLRSCNTVCMAKVTRAHRPEKMLSKKNTKKGVRKIVASRASHTW